MVSLPGRHVALRIPPTPHRLAPNVRHAAPVTLPATMPPALPNPPHTMPKPTLRLHHELLLLALHDERGSMAFGRMIELGLGGALLTELLIEGRIRIVETKRLLGTSRIVEVLDATPVGSPVLDDALAALAGSSRRPSTQHAVSRLARMSGLRRRVASELARHGVLREKEETVLLLFRRRRYPTLDPAPERALVARIRKALESRAEVAPRTAALISLADLTRTLDAVYTRSEQRALRPRIRSIGDDIGGSQALKDAIQAANAAMVAAVAAATAASAASR